MSSGYLGVTGSLQAPLSMLSALMVFGCLATIYKRNIVYDVVEGLAIGATFGNTVVVALFTVQNNIIRRITTNPGKDGYLVVALIMGACYVCLYIRPLVNIFRFVSAISLAQFIAIRSGTNLTSAWSSVVEQTQIFNFDYFVFWAVFLIGLFYYIYGRKIAGRLGPLREAGRWVAILQIGIITTPLLLRYTDAATGHTQNALTSQGWVIPLILSIYIAFDVLNSKYKWVANGQTPGFKAFEVASSIRRD